METKVPPFVLCIGSDRWLRERAVAQIKRRCVAEGFEETDFVRFSELPDETSPLKEAVQTAPFGSPIRLVVVDRIEALTAETIPWLAAYLANPHPKSCLMLCVDKAEAGAIPAELARSGRTQVILCTPLKGRELEQWVIQRAEETGKPIEPRAAALMIARVGSSLQALSLAIENLNLLASGRPLITVQDLESQIGPSLQETAFDILDSAAAGEPARAAEALRQAIEIGKLPMDQFMGALGWYYRMLWNVRTGKETMGWASPRRKAALARTRQWSKEKLQRNMAQLLQADLRFKQGHPHPELLADQLLLQLSG